jgi:hypothetical protein
MEFVSITFDNIKAEVERFLQLQHAKANLLFSPASPYGQILSVLENLHQLSFLYLKNTLAQYDLTALNSTNERIIRNAAIFAGHNPGRAISATGTIRLTLKSNADLEKDVPGGKITIYDRSEVKNNTNSLNYVITLGVDVATYTVNQNTQIFLPITQGKWTTKTRTGTGLQLQTFNFAEPTNKDVENFNVEVLVNGEYWTIKKHIWEMIPEEKACVVRTGFNGGIDLIFGNGGFGMIPPITSTIQISYIITDGSIGNIYRRTRNDWKFLTDSLDGFGGSIDIGKIFDVDIYTDINFGADAEDINFTRTILPIASNNFVLGLPQQYAYEIKKLGVFSHVNAYENQGTIFIVATPNIKLFKNQEANYFTIDIKAFSLDNYEKSKIDKYLRTGGNLQLTRKYRVTSPDLSYYVMNVFIITYSDAIDDTVNSQILTNISDYFLDLGRIDRIPKVDLIKQISAISDIHSVDIQIISKKNEDYHRNAKIQYENLLKTGKFNKNISLTEALPEYNPSETKGLDPVLGDILFDPNEVPIIRGGWIDRNELYYDSNIDGNGLKSVNIIKQGTVDSKNKMV